MCMQECMYLKDLNTVSYMDLRVQRLPLHYLHVFSSNRPTGYSPRQSILKLTYPVDPTLPLGHVCHNSQIKLEAKKKKRPLFLRNSLSFFFSNSKRFFLIYFFPYLRERNARSIILVPQNSEKLLCYCSTMEKKNNNNSSLLFQLRNGAVDLFNNDFVSDQDSK